MDYCLPKGNQCLNTRCDWYTNQALLAKAKKLKWAFQSPKKNFKKAVDRNYFKRVLRETYRLNKHLLIDNLDQPYSFMFFYQTKDRLTYHEINTKTVQLFEKFLLQIKKED